jgi:hypothetical protein
MKAEMQPEMELEILQETLQTEKFEICKNFEIFHLKI